MLPLFQQILHLLPLPQIRLVQRHRRLLHHRRRKRHKKTRHGERQLHQLRLVAKGQLHLRHLQIRWQVRYINKTSRTVVIVIHRTNIIIKERRFIKSILSLLRSGNLKYGENIISITFINSLLIKMLYYKLIKYNINII